MGSLSLPLVSTVNSPYQPNLLANLPLKPYAYLKDYFEYLLIISPPEFIKNDVAGFKNFLAHFIKYFDARHSIAHLTIAAFLLPKSKEKALRQSLHEAVAEEQCVNFTITGFNRFTRNGTLYLDIEEKDCFAQISKNIKKKSLLGYLPGNFMHFTYYPHVTIGKNLKNNLVLACSLFKDISYNHTFTAQSVILLRKEGKERFQFIEEFPFLSRPRRQLTLFNN